MGWQFVGMTWNLISVAPLGLFVGDGARCIQGLTPLAIDYRPYRGSGVAAVQLQFRLHESIARMAKVELAAC